MSKVEKDNKITFFPVGNGDTVLISLKDETNILLDCNITKGSEDPDIEEKFDIISYLLDVLPKDNDSKPHLDAFILSHPDQDHCRNVPDHFYLGDPVKYSDKKDKDKIIIDELWFAPGIFSEKKSDLNNYAKAIRKEAERRMKLYEDKSNEATSSGNRLRIIGATDNEKLEELEYITTPAGSTINLINNKIQKEFNFFVLGPVKAETDDSEAERNQRSIVLKAQFNINSEEVNNVVILAGDSRIENWQRIMSKNKMIDLRFDIFLAPHHCSWYFFSAEDYKKKPAPDAEQNIINFIENGKDDEDIRIVVASCKEIKRNDDNPPHYRAANYYKGAVEEDNFYCLATYPNSDEPKPLVFTFTENGPVKQDIDENQEKKSVATLIKTAATPKTYGRKY